MKHRTSLVVPAAPAAFTTLERRSDRQQPSKESRSPLGMLVKVALFCSDSKSQRATADRRGSGVMAYVGPNGGGKTLCAVQDLLPALMAGKPVWSNTPLVDPRDAGRAGTSFPNFRPLRHADELLEADGGVELLLDEIATVANSRESQRLDPRFQIAFQQLRKRGAAVRFTAPDLARADLIFREVCQMLTECRGFYSDRKSKFDQWGLPDVWAPKRLFRRQTYDAMEFTQWSAGKREKADVLVNEWCYPQRLELDPRHAYNTMQAVDKIAGVTVDGNCAHCGKKARAEYCKGHTSDEIEVLALESAAATEEGMGRHAIAVGAAL